MFETLSSEKHFYFHAVLPGDTLLTAPYFPHLIQKIKAYSGIKGKHHKVLYQQLVTDFAAFVQAIPLIPEGKPGTLLTYSVERAAKSLEKYHQANEKDMDIRFAYALFTAALFQNAGKVIGQQKVSICDSEGRAIEDWLPHSGPMPEDAYYRVWFLDDQWFSISKFSTPLLARQIMPAGFNWIAEDLPIYKMWLEALVGEGDEDENKLLKFFAMVDPGEGGGKRLPATVIKPLQPKATVDGDAFLEWLMDGLDSGKISTNKTDSLVFVLPSGELFLVWSIFQEFSKQHPGHLEWEKVCEQFTQLGMTSNLNDGKVNFDKYLIQKEGQAQESASTWGASHFVTAQKTHAVGTQARAEAMVREGVVVQSLVFGLKTFEGIQQKMTLQVNGQAEQKTDAKMQNLDKFICQAAQKGVDKTGGR